MTAKKKIDEAELEAAAEKLAPVYEKKAEKLPAMYQWGPEDLEPLLSKINSMDDVKLRVNQLFKNEPLNFRELVIIGLIGILKEL